MVAPDKLVDSSTDKAESKGDTGDEAVSITNGNAVQATDDQITNKKAADGSRQPSYVALACCISGYTTLHYDSKQRQSLGSPRPLSPNRLSPVNNGNQNPIYKSECGNFLSPYQPDLSCKMPSEVKGVEVLNGCQSLSSPRHVSRMSITSESRRNFTSSMLSEGYTSYSSSSSSSHYSYSHSTSSTVSSTTTVKTDCTNGSRLIQATKAPTQLSPSSFIVQRVERLYGPGALAQGFYSPRRISSLTKETKGSTPDKNDKNNDSLPVLKLLRPEFRAQLTVASRKSKSPEAKSLSLNSDEENSLSNENNKDPVDIVDATMDKKTENLTVEDIKEGHFFLKLLDENVSELEKLADKADEELEGCDSEEGAGMLRAVSGKARLLVAEKLNQFRGLCHKNLKQTGEEDFPTTNEDLAGFWDMVLIQIKVVIAQFDEVEEMRANNWKQVTPKPKTEIVTKLSGANRKLAPRKLNAEPKVSAASKARDEARRKLIEEKRKAMKNMKKGEEDTVFIV